LCCRYCLRVQPWPVPAPRTVAPSSGIAGATRRVGDAMGLIAAVLIPIILFFWLAFMGTIWCWLQTIICLCQLKFTRATIWFSLGCGGLFWWMGTDIDFDKWLHGSAAIVGLSVLATLLRYLNRILPPRKKLFKPRSPTGFGPKPPANDNQLVVFSLDVK